MTMPKTKRSRDVEKNRLLPPLDDETYSGLKANIALNGVQVPIVNDERGYILDGFARAMIAKELGDECPTVTVRGLNEQEKKSQDEEILLGAIMIFQGQTVPRFVTVGDCLT